MGMRRVVRTIRSFSRVGAIHSQNGEPNQDRIYSKIAGSLYGIALADGAGSARYGGLGAEVACRSACTDVMNSFERYYERESIGTVKEEVMGKVLAELREHSAILGLRECLEELGSTLLVLVVDTRDGRFLCLHLGDGLAACASKDLAGKRMRLLSAPESGITRQFTVLTSSKHCIRRTRVYRGKYVTDTSFFLMSDGCTRYLWNGYEIDPVCGYDLANSTGPAWEEEFADRLQNAEWEGPPDDYSMIAIHCTSVPYLDLTVLPVQEGIPEKKGRTCR
ncbi:MAG: protein phosphatase 2C domain-containing protein [Lachnospiraceae bacterium]|nr:protein phosphatase 2C domain-containing protein [Lachnospiraceae bacterium]